MVHIATGISARRDAEGSGAVKIKGWAKNLNLTRCVDAFMENYGQCSFPGGKSENALITLTFIQDNESGDKPKGT